ncbi:THO complex subunit 7 isoform 1-T2 [Alca torda]
MAAQGRPCLLPHACAMGTSSAPSPRSRHHRASAPWPPPASSHRGGSHRPHGAMATMAGPIHLFPCTITATIAETSPVRGGWGHRRRWQRRPQENARRREGGQGTTPARRPPCRGASRVREHVPGAWRGGPGGGRRGRGRGGGEVEPGCGRGDRRFPPPSAPHLAGPPLARGPVPRGAQASPAGPPRRSSSRRRRAASPPPAGSGPSRRRRRLPLHGRRSRRLHCGKLTSLAAAAAPPAPALAAMGAVTDDEVIRKRLLIDGDGAGDDRRINLLVKSFIKWCNSGSQEEGYSQYQRMLSTLSQCEFSMGKTLLVYDMNLREMENYEKIYKDIENSIAAAHEKISECKKQILQAKRIRKNRQEYDALAKVIQHHPDRHETLKQLEALGKELQHLSHIKENVEDKLELRRKQFHVLLSTIHELQQTLENDEKLSEAEESQETQMETETKQ